MQELSLYGHVPRNREPRIRALLASVAAMAPDRLITHHLVFKPKRPRPQPGSAAQSELYILQLVAEVKEEKTSEDVGMGGVEGSMEEAKAYLEGKKLLLRLNDIPEGGKRPVTSRTVLSSEVAKGDILQFMNNLGYNYVSAYITSGHRLIHNNIIITLTEILTFPPSPSANPQQPHPPPIRSPFPLDKLQKLDPEGSFMLQATVRIHQGTDVESTNIATAELKAFQAVMKGAVEMDIGDRLAMDTRVR